MPILAECIATRDTIETTLGLNNRAISYGIVLSDSQS